MDSPAPEWLIKLLAKHAVDARTLAYYDKDTKALAQAINQRFEAALPPKMEHDLNCRFGESEATANCICGANYWNGAILEARARWYNQPGQEESK